MSYHCELQALEVSISNKRPMNSTKVLPCAMVDHLVLKIEIKSHLKIFARWENSGFFKMVEFHSIERMSAKFQTIFFPSKTPRQRTDSSIKLQFSIIAIRIIGRRLANFSSILKYQTDPDHQMGNCRLMLWYKSYTFLLVSIEFQCEHKI